MKKKSPMNKSKRFWSYGILIFLILLFVDQYTKNYFFRNYALNETHKILPGIYFTFVQNTGTLWGFFNGASANWAFIWLSVIVFGLLIFFYDKFTTVMEKTAYSMLMAGLWGNLLDRGIHGFVIDFIDLRWWPVFNIADACITIAIIIILLEQIRQKK